MTFAALADTVARLADAIDPEDRPHLIGLSFGGMVAQHAALTIAVGPLADAARRAPPSAWTAPGPPTGGPPGSPRSTPGEEPCRLRRRGAARGRRPRHLRAEALAASARPWRASRPRPAALDRVPGHPRHPRPAAARSQAADARARRRVDTETPPSYAPAIAAACRGAAGRGPRCRPPAQRGGTRRRATTARRTLGAERPMTEWRWVQRVRRAPARAAALPTARSCVVLSRVGEPRGAGRDRGGSRRSCTAPSVVDVVVPTPVNPGTVPIRSTAASLAIAGEPAAIAALAGGRVRGRLHGRGPAARARARRRSSAGARVLMISNEHPEVFERLALRSRPGPARRSSGCACCGRARDAGHADAGTDLTVRLRGRRPSPGRPASRPARDRSPTGPAGWCRVPGRGTVNGTLVLAPGDLNLTFKRYVELADRGCDRRRLRRRRRRATVSTPSCSRAYLAAFGEREALRPSHVGWGLNPAAAGTCSRCTTRATSTAPRLRAFAGNFLYSSRRQRGRGAVRPADTSTCRCSAARSRWTAASWSTPASSPPTCARQRVALSPRTAEPAEPLKVTPRRSTGHRASRSARRGSAARAGAAS